MTQFTRVIAIVIDACGIGGARDAARFGDVGAATIPNVARAVGGLAMPICESLGLGNCANILGVAPQSSVRGSWGVMNEISVGKDSTIGHWELMGLPIAQPLSVYPGGFPASIISAFEKKCGVTTIGNKPSSGTEIIAELGARHQKSGEIIVYTSADSVFQIAAHEETVPLKTLYHYCTIARELLKGEHNVGRVIARPFLGAPGSYTRTANRRDFSAVPPGDTALDLLANAGKKTLAIGKIWDLFAGQGIASSIKTVNNSDGIQKIHTALDATTEWDFLFANLVDFDQEFGHRNDERGFARALEEFDTQLGVEILPRLTASDLLLITADHGCDPTLKLSTDHTREQVPLLAYSPTLTGGISLGERSSFADFGKTILEVFQIKNDLAGRSFAEELR